MRKEVTIREILVPALEAAFPSMGMCCGEPPDPVVVFPAICPEVGDVQIYDDGDEATIYIENVTHEHVNPYDSEMPPDGRTRWITDNVTRFLRALFDDRIVLFVMQDEGGGGWQSIDDIPREQLPRDADVFVWSKRLQGSRH
ncbi:MAG: hypothetical protein RL885_32260 [Planctomycetota bacterium]